MIGYLKGLIVELTPSVTYIDVHGVGYEVHITLNTYHHIKDKQEAFLYTHLHIREDVQQLFGFAHMDEKNAFIKLIGVSGIGVNTARIMLSSLTTNELYTIIEQADNKALERIKGIGTKTAQLIILQLKGKINLIDTEISNTPAAIYNNLANDALHALIGLGISKNMAESALKKVQADKDNEHISIEEMIKLALKNL